MLTIGCHLSCAKGYLAMGQDAVEIGANTLQFFTRNPRGGKARELHMDDVEAFLALIQDHAFGPILAHAPYTMNLCSKDAGVRAFGLAMMQDDLARLEYMPGNYYNFHPGSHVGQGLETGIVQITAQLNQALTPAQKTIVLLETMAGKGSEIGSSFEELRKILEGVHLPEKMGVCLDTCHVYDAGYDLAGDLEAVLQEFDHVVGLEHLRAIHLNDSMHPFASHKDRHQKIGEGTLGLETFYRILRHPKLCHLPFYLETPHDTLAGYAGEIAMLRRALQEG